MGGIALMSYVIDAKIAMRGCPSMGLCDDRETFYAFPSYENCCRTEAVPFPIEPSYQAATCLTEEWSACARYLAAQDGTKPQPAVAGWRQQIRAAPLAGWVLAGILVGACLIAGVLLLILPL
jgi:hypothetical protein